MAKKLYRSKNDRMLAGVCGGLGEYFDFDPVIIRLIFVVCVLAGGAGVLAYIVLWVVVPEQNGVSHAQNIKKSLEDDDKKTEFKKTAKAAADEIKSAAHDFSTKRRGDRSVVGAAILIMLGIILLVGNFIPLFRFAKLWPLILVVVGLTMLISSIDKE